VVVLAVSLIIITVCSFYDYQNKIIPNNILIPAFVFLIIINDSSNTNHRRLLLASLVFFTFILFRKLTNNKLGMGDIKLISLIAFSFGIAGTWITLFLACISSLIYILVKNKFLRQKSTAIPFAPFLLLGSCITIAIHITNVLVLPSYFW
jgi:prepilin signal peptidase PulO-like enzyme (type II secretory pathway)